MPLSLPTSKLPPTGTRIEWVTEWGQQLCQLLEPLVSPIGFHVALGGSVIYKGWSSKDLDVILYPHKLMGNDVASRRKELVDTLQTLEGLEINLKTTLEEYPLDWIFSGTYESKRVDFFLLDRIPRQQSNDINQCL